MMARSVVLLPAPLRPSSVTSSPSPILKSIPCRMCDSPYQACKFSTRSSSLEVRMKAAVSRMSGPHIGLYDLGVAGDRGVIALGQDAAAGQYRDGVGQIGDDRQIVLDHQHRAVSRHLPDQPGNAADVLLA